jgi:hypothetical protein
MGLASVPDIGRTLRRAREDAGFAVAAAADRAGVTPAELEALESGTVARMDDRVETLRALRSYANSLGLPGNDYVLAVVDLWPTTNGPARNGDTGVVPVVSLTAAPAGGHSPVGGSASALSNGHSGVTESGVTSVVAPVMARRNDTGQVPIVDTGQIPIVRTLAPGWLKALVGVVAVLVALGVVGLILHNHLSGWINQAKVAVGISPHQSVLASPGGSTTTAAPKATTTTTAAHHAAAAKASAGKPRIEYVVDKSANAVVINVHLSSFNAKVACYGHASWLQATSSTNSSPLYAQILRTGGTKVFPVSGNGTSLKLQTGNVAARVFLYKHGTLIGYWIPPNAPYTLTINSVS